MDTSEQSGQPSNETAGTSSKVVAAGSEKGSGIYPEAELTGQAEGQEDMEMG